MAQNTCWNFIQKIVAGSLQNPHRYGARTNAKVTCLNRKAVQRFLSVKPRSIRGRLGSVYDTEGHAASCSQSASLAHRRRRYAVGEQHLFRTGDRRFHAPAQPPGNVAAGSAAVSE